MIIINHIEMNHILPLNNLYGIDMSLNKETKLNHLIYTGLEGREKYLECREKEN